MTRNYLRIAITFIIFFLISLCAIFFFNNKNDVFVSLSDKEKLTYEYAVANCSEVENKVYAPCLLKNVEDFFKKVSLTGVSVGLNYGFIFLEEDKKQSEAYPEGIERDVLYSLFYLRLNNLAISYSNEQFLGISFLYGFFISGLYDFYSKAFDFSEDMIKGLQSEDGISKIEDEELRMSFQQEFVLIEKRYLELREEKEKFLASESERLKK